MSVLGNKTKQTKSNRYLKDISGCLYKRAFCNRALAFLDCCRSQSVCGSFNEKHPLFCRELGIRVPKNIAVGPGSLKFSDPQAGPRSLYIFGGWCVCVGRVFVPNVKSGSSKSTVLIHRQKGDTKNFRWFGEGVATGFLPSGLRNDHLCTPLVKLVPKFLGLQVHLGVVFHVLLGFHGLQRPQVSLGSQG